MNLLNLFGNNKKDKTDATSKKKNSIDLIDEAITDAFMKGGNTNNICNHFAGSFDKFEKTANEIYNNHLKSKQKLDNAAMGKLNGFLFENLKH